MVLLASHFVMHRMGRFGEELRRGLQEAEPPSRQRQAQSQWSQGAAATEVAICESGFEPDAVDMFAAELLGALSIARIPDRLNVPREDLHVGVRPLCELHPVAVEVIAGRPAPGRCRTRRRRYAERRCSNLSITRSLPLE
jgi:hypothetical protein